MTSWKKLSTPSVRALFEKWRDCSLIELEWRISMIRRQTLYQHLTPAQWETLDRMRAHAKEKKTESFELRRDPDSIGRERAVSEGDGDISPMERRLPDSVFFRQIFPPKETNRTKVNKRRPTIKDL
jgi:DNA-binding PadR family transcriptional regulator